MPYVKSPMAVERVRKYLELLVSAEETQVAWSTSNPKKFQYLLHNGINVANILKDDYPDFAHLKDTWRINIKADMVIATKRILQEVEEPSLLFENVKDVYEVIQTLTSNKDVNVPIKFTSISLDDEELTKLENWCKQFNYTFNYFNKETLSVLKDRTNDN